MAYFVYLLECADGTLYTGITTDVLKRVSDHNLSLRGAKYTRSRRPVRLRYSEKVASKSAALKREIAIKRLTRQQKLSLIKKQP